MDIRVAVLWILVGWCGTPWPKPWPPLPPEQRQSYPWIFKLVGIIGGFAGGWLFNQVWPVEGSWTAIGAAVSAVGAWVGALTLINLLAIGTWPTPEIPRT